MYGIPKETLIKKLHLTGPLVRKMGPSSVISPEEEDRLEHWIIAKAKLGFPMHPDEVKDSVQKIVQDLKRENPFVDDRPGRKWMELFLKRRPGVTKINTDIISKARASVTEQSIKDWFNKVVEHLKSKTLSRF